MRSDSVQPAVRPGLQLGHRGRELAAFGGQFVGDLRRRAVAHVALDDAPRLELLHPLRQQAVAEILDGVGDLREAHATAVQQDVEDRAGPALAHELDRLVVARTAPAFSFSGVRDLGCRRGPGLHARYAARSPRVSSTEPSTGTSPATLTMAVKDSMESTAMASSSSCSLQPASRASSWRCWGKLARSPSSGRR